MHIRNVSSAVAKVGRTIRSRTGVLLAIISFAFIAIILAIVHLSGLRSDFYWWKHDRVLDLKQLPLGTVTLHGVVTYVDEANERFWMQDESGALAVNVPPKNAGVQYGQLVRVQARKTHAYDAQFGFPSLALVDYRVRVLKPHEALPLPAAAAVNNLPQKEKNGTRIRLEGVLRAVTYHDRQLTALSVGKASREVSVVIPGKQTTFSNWINATVQVTGVSDLWIDAGGASFTTGAHMWVQNAEDIQKVQDAPPSIPLESLRDLYRRQNEERSHRVRLRGSVVSIEQGSLVLVEDPWGVLACRSDSVVDFAPNTPVEVSGFPHHDGVRIDLSHCSVQQIAESELVSRHQSTSITLTTIEAVRRLSAQQAAEALPVRLTGVVTYADSDWRQFFVQDSTGGIFVRYAGSPGPVLPGEQMVITGMTGAGDFAPIVVGPKLVFLGKGPLPKPVPMGARAWSGQLDSMFVEVEGIVRPPSKRQNPKHIGFNLYTSFGPVSVDVSPDFGGIAHLQDFTDARVKIRGVCGEVFNSKRQLIGVSLELYSPTDIEVLERGTTNPSGRAVIPINELLTFSRGLDFNHSVRVTGPVTMVGNGFFYIQDATGGARVEAETSGLSVSDRVDVLGYASPGTYTPAMTDAAVQILEHNVPVTAEEVTAEEPIGGAFDSRLISIDGTLLSVVSSIDSKNLVLRSEGHTFDAVLYLSNSEQNPPPLEEGSIMCLVGICAAELRGSTAYSLKGKDPIGFTVMIRSPQDIQVLKAASWWNLRHTSLILAILFAIVLAGLAWVARLGRRIRNQREALVRAREKEAATQQLTRAMQEVTTERRFTSRVSVQGADEIAHLSIQFNKMLAELEVGEAARIQAESKLRHLALTDELTGLPNRRLFASRLSQLLASAERSRGIVVLIYIDLDGFKLVNDSLGHSIGDALLGQVAERLQSRIRKSDTLARLGGDEFVVALTQLRKKEEAELVATSLLRVLAEPFNIDSHEISISASFGISVYPDNSKDATLLLQQADSAMYAAKRSGKNRILYFKPEIGSQARERMSLEHQLRAAIARKEISVHYQPEFDVNSQRLIRFEALARWTHPTLGSIPPDKFIPIAEETGIIIPLGMYILERACADAVRWQEISPDPIQVAVNVSSIQFSLDTFVDQVEEVLRQTGLAPTLLQIELTESVMLGGAERTAESMRRLRTMGVSIAIDDFGTGYSCFSYLPKLPFNALKIDRSFVRELGSVEMKAMIQSLVTLAHHLDMQVVVEGIETEEQLEMIKKLGGNQVQGYLLGRPTAEPMSEIEGRKTAHGLVSDVLSNATKASTMKASAS